MEIDWSDALCAIEARRGLEQRIGNRCVLHQAEANGYEGHVCVCTCDFRERYVLRVAECFLEW